MPVLVSSGAGGVALVAFFVHGFRRRWAVLRPVQEVARYALFFTDSTKEKGEVEDISNVSIPTRDGVTLKGYWKPLEEEAREAPVVILFAQRTIFWSQATWVIPFLRRINPESLTSWW